METRGCEWPDGCNRGAFRTVAVPDGRNLALCLRHAGETWNRRKSANRAAGRCPCGAEPTPGYRTCEACRERGRRDRKRVRAFNAKAADMRSQRAARRAWRRSWARGSLRSLGPFTRTVAVSWEGHAVTVRATFDMSRGGMKVHGILASAA